MARYDVATCGMKWCHAIAYMILWLYFWRQLVLLDLPATLFISYCSSECRMQAEQTAKTWRCIMLKVLLLFSFKYCSGILHHLGCSFLRFHLLRVRQCLGQVIQTTSVLGNPAWSPKFCAVSKPASPNLRNGRTCWVFCWVSAECECESFKYNKNHWRISFHFFWSKKVKMLIV